MLEAIRLDDSLMELYQSAFDLSLSESMNIIFPGTNNGRTRKMFRNHFVKQMGLSIFRIISTQSKDRGNHFPVRDTQSFLARRLTPQMVSKGTSDSSGVRVQDGDFRPAGGRRKPLPSDGDFKISIFMAMFLKIH